MLVVSTAAPDVSMAPSAEVAADAVADKLRASALAFAFAVSSFMRFSALVVEIPSSEGISSGFARDSSSGASSFSSSSFSSSFSSGTSSVPFSK